MIEIKVEKSNKFVFILLLFVIYPGAELVSSWLAKIIGIDSALFDVAIMMGWVILTFSCIVKLEHYLPNDTQILQSEFYDEYVLLKKSKSIRKIYYSDIREVEKIMVINRMNIDKGYYRVKIKCKRKNYVVYSTSDEHRQQLDFEDTGISELYFELKRRGVKCC